MPELTYTSNRSVSGVLLSRNPSDIWNLTFCSWCWCSAYWIWRRQSRPSFHACPKPRKREQKLLLIRHSAICISHGFVLVEVEGWKSTSSCQHLPNITLSWQVSLQSFPNYISRISALSKPGKTDTLKKQIHTTPERVRGNKNYSQKRRTAIKLKN